MGTKWKWNIEEKSASDVLRTLDSMARAQCSAADVMLSEAGQLLDSIISNLSIYRSEFKNGYSGETIEEFLDRVLLVREEIKQAGYAVNSLR